MARHCKIFLVLAVLGVVAIISGGREHGARHEDEDFYKLLGVDESADDTAIRKAFRSLSLKYHPDKNPSAKAKKRFVRISQAYEVLTDPSKRQEYDRKRKVGGGPGPGTMTDEMANMIFENLFREQGGTGRREEGPNTGLNVGDLFSQVFGSTAQGDFNSAGVGDLLSGLAGMQGRSGAGDIYGNGDSQRRQRSRKQTNHSKRARRHKKSSQRRKKGKRQRVDSEL